MIRYPEVGWFIIIWSCLGKKKWRQSNSRSSGEPHSCCSWCIVPQRSPVDAVEYIKHYPPAMAGISRTWNWGPATHVSWQQRVHQNSRRGRHGVQQVMVYSLFYSIDALYYDADLKAVQFGRWGWGGYWSSLCHPKRKGQILEGAKLCCCFFLPSMICFDPIAGTLVNNLQLGP